MLLQQALNTLQIPSWMSLFRRCEKQMSYISLLRRPRLLHLLFLLLFYFLLKSKIYAYL